MIKVKLDCNNEIYKIYKEEVKEYKEINSKRIDKIKTVKTLEKVLLEELESQNFVESEICIFEAFQHEIHNSIYNKVIELVEIPYKYSRMFEKYSMNNYDIDIEEDEPRAIFNIFMDYMESKALGEKTTFLQFLNINQI